ncbi:hypothetical protein IAE33_003145 [Pseudomonas sp. S60]|uniref:hypothetical protein n=1 Tax=Pseudomonas sp. S60 TaxID=211124 RepID=UPI001914808C|nr:hypothetical protein [Pseudomonas sp. S60]MBK5011285.1 hypothetical protein [Pseudomonas sp. S60]
MLKPLLTPQQARAMARKARAKVSLDDNLVAPSIDPALLADPADNTVWRAVLKEGGDDFVLSIPKWALSGRKDTVVLHVEGSEDELFSGEYSRADEADFPIPAKIEKLLLDAMAEGRHAFVYEVIAFNGSVKVSEPLALIFDRMDPYYGDVPPAPPAITDVLEANKDKVKVTIPANPNWAEKDTVRVFWLAKVPEDPLKTPPAATAVLTSAAAQTLDIPQAHIEATGDGGISVFYVLIDKAGNFSHVSEPVQVGVALGAFPTAFALPVVDLAADGLIDQADVALGVVVDVLRFDNHKPSDEVRVLWGSATSEWRAIGSDTFPLQFSVSALDILTEYGGPSAQGEKVAKVAYEVRRGTVLLTKPNPTIDVKVNLERFGPGNPDWPEPINPVMLPAKVFGRNSKKENELIDTDAGQPADVLIEIDAAFDDKDVVSLYWDGVHVAEADHPLTAAEVGTEISLSIPWAYILSTGNRTVPMHYEIRRGSNPNAARPEETSVVVDAVVVVPDAPQFDGIASNGMLRCEAIWSDPPHADDPAIRVVVAELSQWGLAAGDTIKMIWRATTAFDKTPIPEAGHEEEVTLDADTLKGFIWRIPYVDYVLPIYEADEDDRDGYGYVRFEFTLHGKPGSSKEEEVYVSMHDAGGSCALPSP